MMKKSLVALAALAVAGIASAQSSVTLFGILDAGISYNEAKTNNVPGKGTVKQSQWSQSNSGYNSSRIGFRGTEDLGGGLAASFWLEAGLNNDTGVAGGTVGVGGNTAGAPTTGNALFNRRSTVSLSGGFGEVRIGRDYSATFWNDTVFDPFGTNGTATNLLLTAHAADINVVRTSNAVAYFLPSNLGGFYGQVQYGLPESVKTTGANANTAGRYIGGRFGYANGPLDVALAYGESTVAETVGVSVGKVKTANLGASYDFGVVKAFGEIGQVKNDVNFNAPFLVDTSAKANGLLLGATAPIGAGLIRASFSTAKFSIPGPDPRVNKYALGYVHNLSKRTALYATVAYATNKDFSAVGTAGAPVAPTGGGSPAYVTGGFAKSSTGYDFGVRHAF